MGWTSSIDFNHTKLEAKNALNVYVRFCEINRAENINPDELLKLSSTLLRIDKFWKWFNFHLVINQCHTQPKHLTTFWSLSCQKSHLFHITDMFHFNKDNNEGFFRLSILFNLQLSSMSRGGNLSNGPKLDCFEPQGLQSERWIRFVAKKIYNEQVAKLLKQIAQIWTSPINKSIQDKLQKKLFFLYGFPFLHPNPFLRQKDFQSPWNV